MGFSGPLLPFPHVAEGDLMGPVHTEAHTAVKTEAHSYQDTAAPLPGWPAVPLLWHQHALVRDVRLCTCNLTLEHTHTKPHSSSVNPSLPQAGPVGSW